MDHDASTDSGLPIDGSPPSEAWLFAQVLLGNPLPRIVSPEAKARAKREELERLAPFSIHHAEELRKLQAAEAAARHDRKLWEWCARISTQAEETLRAMQRKEAAEREAWRRAERFVEARSAGMTEWNEADHPRASQGQSDGGRWVLKGGGGGATAGGSGGSVAPASTQLQAVGQQSTTDPSRWYLPAENKGTWLGAKGDSTFRLETPLNVEGKLVHEIHYQKGVPVLDKFTLPGKTVTIVLTGDSRTDIRNAQAAWQKLNPGKTLPPRSIFHHDLLHVVEETVTMDGKKTKLLVGKMHLVPRSINELVFHEGSASVANKFYRGLGIDVGAVKQLAKKEASLVGEAGSLVARAASKIVPGKIAKGVLPFLGRSVVRVIPIATTGLAILEFSDNVEAHGVGGAVARAIPLLGDLISAHDLGSDLAKQIVDEANAASDAHLQALNAPVSEAWKKASEQTIAAFQDLAPQIQVTNVYGPNGLVDPHEVTDALKIYRAEMQHANLLQTLNNRGFDFDAAAARSKQELKERLTKASQKQTPPNPGPIL